MPWTQTDLSFKKLSNKRITTSTGKGLPEEKGASTLELYLPDIKTGIIPGTPPNTTTDILFYTGAIGQTLVVDTSVPNNLTYFATTGYGNTTSANDGSALSESARLGDWVSDKYDAFGTVSGAGYEIKVYDRNSNLITKSDSSNWLFDYQTGILVFNNNLTSYGTGVSTSGPFRIVGHRYVGQKGVIPATYGGLGYTTYTLGDLFVGSGNTVFKLPVGTDNFVLTADSTAGYGLTWKSTAATGITTLNSLTSNFQYFEVGTSGNSFNISSSGSTHTFNIPIAGTGATGLVSTLDQSFAGIKTFTNDVVLSSSTASISTSSGALTVTGGVGIGGSLFVTSAANVSGIILNNSVITSGTWAGNTITAYYGGTGYNSYTKGDILVGSGNTFIKLPVGTDGYVLGADSSRPSGIGWTTVTGVTVSDNAPPSPKSADLWYNSTDGGLLIYYNDGDTSQWTEINLGSGIDLTQQFVITNTSNAYDTSSGALVVNGGAGFASTVFAQSFSVNGGYDFINSSLVTSTTTADQVALSINSAVFRTLKITVQVKSSTNFHSQEILMTHDGTDVYMTEYAAVYTSAVLTTFNGDINSGNIRLLVTPTNAISTYKIACMAIRD
jgi:hypothetical protein